MLAAILRFARASFGITTSNSAAIVIPRWFLSTGMENLRGLRALAYCYCSPSLPRLAYRDRLRNGYQCCSLCSGFNLHRPLSFYVSMGAIQKSQGRRQTTYAAGRSFKYPSVYRYYKRQHSRHPCPRPAASSAWFLSRSRSCLYGFQAPVSADSERCVLCHQSKRESRLQTPLLSSGRQINWRAVRSKHRSNWSQIIKALSECASPSSLLFSRERTTIYLFDQQLRDHSQRNRRYLSNALDHRNILQMDKTEPSNQEFLWNINQQCQDSSLGFHLRLRAGSNCQKAFGIGSKPLPNSTGFEPKAI